MSSHLLDTTLVNKFVKQTKIDSRLTHKGGLDQVGLVEAETDKGAGGTGILWKADPTVWQEEPGLDPPHRVRNQRGPLLSLLFGDRGTQILDFDQALAHENNLGNSVDARHPRIADELWIQCGNADRLFRISRGCGFPFQNAWRTVQFTNGIDVGDEIIARTQCPIELNLLG
jgi:hypothetical protein